MYVMASNFLLHATATTEKVAQMIGSCGTASRVKRPKTSCWRSKSESEAMRVFRPGFVVRPGPASGAGLHVELRRGDLDLAAARGRAVRLVHVGRERVRLHAFRLFLAARRA